MRLVYLDHAATGFPKPPGVVEAMVRYMEEVGGNPGRSGHRLSVEAGRILYQCRSRLANLFGAPSSDRVIFTKNATEAINLAFGVLKQRDEVVVTPFQHNAVMRPLHALCERRGVKVHTISPKGGTAAHHWLEEFERLCFQVMPRIVVVNHGSNVMGEVVPLEDVSRVAKETGALLLVDAAQTAGVLPIDVQRLKIDYLAFTGHKGLGGPKGTGGLVISGDELPPPLVCGGTGSNSEEEVQPQILPDLYESGTPNAEGIAGLNAALEWLESVGLERIHAHERGLLGLFMERFKGMEGISLWGPQGDERVAVCSVLVRGMDPGWTSTILDQKYGIMTRPGLHCAPSAHRAIGTFPEGTVRISFGFTNTEDDVAVVIDALSSIAREATP